MENNQGTPKELQIYNENISKNKEEIQKKILNTEKKLLSLSNKESIVNSIIMKTNMELENIDPKHFKAVGQIRSTLTKQFETLSLINDMIIKFEDLIQKYRKMLIDIDNQGINNFIKFQKEMKETEETEGDLQSLLEDLNKNIKGSKDITSSCDPHFALLQSVQEDLDKEGY